METRVRPMRRARRAVLWLVASLAAFVLVAGLVLWLIAWRKLPYIEPAADVALAAPILTRAEYDAVIATHARPFVFDVETSGGALLIFGAEHTKDPADPQLADLEARWRAFRPTVALIESDLGILFPGLMDPVREFGEAGAVKAFAERHGVPAFTWEPERAVLIDHLLAAFSRERVAARFILNPYFSNLRHGRPAAPETFVEECRAKRTRWPGLEGTFASVADLDAFWAREFPNGPDWRDVSDQFGLPGFLGEMDLNAPRDEHFARAVVDLVRRGERVFAVCGSSHAVKIERALRATLSPAPSRE